MKRNLVLIGCVVALVGLMVNLATDLDNVYDNTLAILWVLTVVLIFAGVLVGSTRFGGS